MRADRALADEIARRSGTWLAAVSERPVYVTDRHSLARVTAGVYVAADRTGQLLYIGSVCRKHPGLRGRIVEHLRAHKRGWDHLWVVALRPDTPPSVVLGIEGLAIDLYDPPQNRRRNANAHMAAV
jgi:hypothetical protein